MNTIRLHGALAKEFGSSFRMDVQTAREAFIALCSQLEGFEQRVKEGAFRIIKTKKQVKYAIDYDTLDLSADNCTIHIYPAMVGGKSGLGKVLIGVAIIGLAIVTSGASLAPTLSAAGTAMTAGIGFMGLTYAGIATFGAMIAFGGLAMMLAPSPKAKSAVSAKDDSSFIINGPTNTMFQGVCVPLLYGEYITGSVVISSELTVAQLIAAGSSYTASTAWTNFGFASYPNGSSGLALADVATVNSI